MQCQKSGSAFCILNAACEQSHVYAARVGASQVAGMCLLPQPMGKCLSAVTLCQSPASRALLSRILWWGFADRSKHLNHASEKHPRLPTRSCPGARSAMISRPLAEHLWNLLTVSAWQSSVVTQHGAMTWILQNGQQQMLLDVPFCIIVCLVIEWCLASTITVLIRRVDASSTILPGEVTRCASEAVYKLQQ